MHVVPSGQLVIFIHAQTSASVQLHLQIHPWTVPKIFVLFSVTQTVQPQSSHEGFHYVQRSLGTN